MEVPEELALESLKALEIARNTGKVSRGTNESIKEIERNKAKLVYIAKDVEPPEIVAHLPGLCDEKKIPYIYVPKKSELGKASGIDVSTAAVSIVDVGKAKKEIDKVVEKLEALKKAPKTAEEKKAEKPAEAKPPEKPPEKPKAEKPPEKKEEKPAEEKPEEKPPEKKAEQPPEEKPEEKPAEKKSE